LAVSTNMRMDLIENQKKKLWKQTKH
jgi:hypothetical protein